MEILGIGPQELILIIIVALIVLGPKDMQKAGKTVGKWLNDLIHSDGWKLFQRTSREIRNLPTNLMREANMEEFQQLGKDLREAVKPPFDSKSFTIGTPATPPTLSQPPAQKAEPADEPTPPTPPSEQEPNA
jgi:sec-independent protein translocase protein TatB